MNGTRSRPRRRRARDRARRPVRRRRGRPGDHGPPAGHATRSLRRRRPAHRLLRCRGAPPTRTCGAWTARGSTRRCSTRRSGSSRRSPPASTPTSSSLAAAPTPTGSRGTATPTPPVSRESACCRCSTSGTHAPRRPRARHAGLCAMLARPNNLFGRPLGSTDYDPLYADLAAVGHRPRGARGPRDGRDDRPGPLGDVRDAARPVAPARADGRDGEPHPRGRARTPPRAAGRVPRVGNRLAPLLARPARRARRVDGRHRVRRPHAAPVGLLRPAVRHLHRSRGPRSRPRPRRPSGPTTSCGRATSRIPTRRSPMRSTSSSRTPPDSPTPTSTRCSGRRRCASTGSRRASRAETGRSR